MVKMSPPSDRQPASHKGVAAVRSLTQRTHLLIRYLPCARSAARERRAAPNRLTIESIERQPGWRIGAPPCSLPLRANYVPQRSRLAWRRLAPGRGQASAASATTRWAVAERGGVRPWRDHATMRAVTSSIAGANAQPCQAVVNGIKGACACAERH